MKTFDELRLQAEAIRDAVNENENTAERVGGHLLDTVEKMQSLDIGKVADAVLQAENAAAEAKEQAEIVGQASEVIEMAKEQGDVAAAQGNMAEAAAADANAAADKATNKALFKIQQDLSEEEQGQVKRNLGIEDLMASLETQTIEGFSETVNATTSTKSVDNIIPPSIDFAIVDLGSTDGRELPTTPSMSVVLAKVTDDGRVKMQGYLKTSHEEYNIQVVSGSAEKYALNVNIITDIETTYKVFQIRYLSSSDGGKFKGSYGQLSQLQAAYPTAGDGSYAFVGNPRHLYEWATNAWTDRGEFTTSVDQAIDSQSERAIANKAVSAKLTELERKTGDIIISENLFLDGDIEEYNVTSNGYIERNGNVVSSESFKYVELQNNDENNRTLFIEANIPYILDAQFYITIAFYIGGKFIGGYNRSGVIKIGIPKGLTCKVSCSSIKKSYDHIVNSSDAPLKQNIDKINKTIPNRSYRSAFIDIFFNKENGTKESNITDNLINVSSDGNVSVSDGMGIWKTIEVLNEKKDRDKFVIYKFTRSGLSNENFANCAILNSDNTTLFYGFFEGTHVVKVPPLCRLLICSKNNLLNEAYSLFPRDDNSEETMISLIDLIEKNNQYIIEVDEYASSIDKKLDSFKKWFNINSEIQDFKQGLFNDDGTTWDAGASWCCGKLLTNGISKLRFTGNARASYPVRFFSSKNVLLGTFGSNDGSSTTSYKEQEISIPQNTEWIGFTFYGNAANGIDNVCLIEKYDIPTGEQFATERYVQEQIDKNNLKHYFTGKKGVWLGTSIPAQGYPQLVAQKIGMHIENEAQGSSMCRMGNSSTIATDRLGDDIGCTDVPWPNMVYSLSMSQKEKKRMFDRWTTERRKELLMSEDGYSSEDVVDVVGYADLMQGDFYGEDTDETQQDQPHEKPKDIMLENYKEFRKLCYSCCWDNSEDIEDNMGVIEGKIQKYLTEDKFPDVWFIDHSHNDGLAQGKDDIVTIPENPYNRNYFIGAVNFIISKIISYNRNAKIILIGHYTDSEKATNFASLVTQGQREIAKYWQIPLIKTWELLPVSQAVVTTTGYWDSEHVWHDEGFDGSNHVGGNFSGISQNPRQENGVWVHDLTMKQIMFWDDLHPSGDYALEYYASVLSAKINSLFM